MSAPLLAFVGVLIGAGVAASASVVTAFFAARLTERRETRARLFDVRREVYVEVLRSASVAREALINSVVDDAGLSAMQASTFMAQLELLGTPEVHQAFGELMVPLVGGLQLRATLPSDASDDDLAELFGSNDMQAVMAAVGPAEVRLRDLMRRDLGNPPIGTADLAG